jgi:hypothetical protein
MEVSPDHIFDFRYFFFEEFVGPQTEGVDTTSVKSASEKSYLYDSAGFISFQEFRTPFGQTLQLRVEAVHSVSDLIVE